MPRSLAPASAALLLAMALGVAGAPAPAQTAAPGLHAAASDLEADAAAALDRMGAFLRTLKTFEVTSRARLEKSFADSPTLEFGLETRYLVQMPDRMAVDVKTDRAHRRIVYDGKQITVVGMTAGRYVQGPVEGSISDLMLRARDNYGIDFPLQDLLRWGSPTGATVRPVSGFRVGEATIGGRKAGHYAFRFPDVDLQLWLAEGAEPLPLRMLITGRDATGLRYAADLDWNLSPRISADSFRFQPRPGDRAIDINSFRSAGR